MNYLDYFHEMKKQLRHYQAEFDYNVTHVQNEIDSILATVQSWKLARGQFFEIMPLFYELSGLSSGYPVNKTFQSLEHSRKKHFNSFGFNQNDLPIIDISPVNLNYSNSMVIYHCLPDVSERITIHAVIESVYDNKLFFDKEGGTFVSSYSQLITLNDKEKIALMINHVNGFWIRHYYYDSDNLIEKIYMEMYRYTDKKGILKIDKSDEYNFHIQYDKNKMMIYESGSNYLVFQG